MFPANYGTTQLLLLLFIYAGCFLLSLPLCANRHVAAAESPISFSFDFTNSSSYDGRDLRLEGDANVHGNRVSLTCNSHTSRNCTALQEWSSTPTAGCPRRSHAWPSA
jgi:hypothetical protein